MNNKTLSFIGIIFLVLSSCKTEPSKKDIAKYIGDIQNGLTKKVDIESGSIICQLIPEYKAGESQTDSNKLFHFNVYINTKKELVTDSIYYHFGYHSANLFKTVVASDTLLPVLSELMANGRREKNQFTVVFEPKKMNDSRIVNFIIDKNELIKNIIQFQFKQSDIKQAYKNIY